MGRGNWFPGSRLEESRVVYVDLLDGIDDEELNDDSSVVPDMRYADFRYNLCEAAGRSFDWKIDHRSVAYVMPYLGRDDIVIGMNSLVAILIDGQGDYNHLGIGFLVREDAPSFAASRLDQLAGCVFDKLDDFYSLRVRTSAWTSSPRAKPQPKKRKQRERELV